MGRIITQVKVENALDPTKGMELSALVDTGATHLCLPKEWMGRFGAFKRIREVNLHTAIGDVVTGLLAGPTELKINNFESVFIDIMFVDMKPDEDGEYEPLLGYIPLEAANVAIDMVGHRLFSAKRFDLK